METNLGFRQLNKVVSTERVSDTVACTFCSILKEYGAAVVRMSSGESWAIHLGDYGDIDDLVLTFVDQAGLVHVLVLDHIESITTVPAHKIPAAN